MKMFKRIILSLVLIVTLSLTLVSCDTIKQVISDAVEGPIQEQINEMLGLADAPEAEQFKLPEATRYENFKINVSEDGKTQTYAGDVFEPQVSFEEYAEELTEILGADFTRADIEDVYEEIKSAEKWSYEDESGCVYTFNFKELLKEDGVTVERWNFEVTVYDPNGTPSEDTPTE